MEVIALVAVALAAGGLTMVLVQSHARRQIAEARTELAAQLAATNQDNKWLTEEIDRQKAALGATQQLLDKAELRLRDVFQSPTGCSSRTV